MRNKILYVSTEDLNFFYKLNKELNRLNIKFEILNLKIKNPKVPSLILTTFKEALKFKNIPEKLEILPYSEGNNFYNYIFKVLAAYRVGYKKRYSEIVFSVDPGSKKIGIVIFLDNFFLISDTFYDKNDFIKLIKDIVYYFQDDNPNLMMLKFKFGSGVLSLTYELVDFILDLFHLRKKMRLYLIDETKSSKIKIKDYKKRVKTKHEISALILALRKGVEITQLNYLSLFKQSKVPNYKKSNHKENINYVDNLNTLQELIDKILDGEISLSESSAILHEITKE
ncbi:MAG: hypothetical protein ACFFCE_00760 [Promethearchaeota archaeon]